MTSEEAMNLLMSAYGNEVIKGGRGCGKTAFRTALLMGANAIKVLEQYKWERDVAISQLEELGLSLGEKTDDVQQAINFKKYFDELYGEGLEVANWHLNGDLEPFDNFYESALQNGN